MRSSAPSDLVDAGVLRAGLGRERQERDARHLAKEPLGAAGGRDRNIGQFRRARIGIHGAVREHEGPRPGAEEIRQDHEEIARRQRNAGGQPDRHQSGFDDAARRVCRARDHGLRVALAHHHAGEIKRLAHQPDAHRGRHIFARAGANRAVALRARIAAWIDQRDAAKVDAGGGGGFGDRVRRAEDDRIGDFPINETARRGEHARILAFG